MGTDCSIAIKKASGEIIRFSLDRYYVFGYNSGLKTCKWYSDIVFLGIISVAVADTFEKAAEDQEWKDHYLDYYLHWLNEAALVIKNNPSCEFAIVTDQEDIEDIK